MSNTCISIYNEFSNIGPTRRTWLWRLKVKKKKKQKTEGGGGGGARKSVRTPSSNIVEFKMGIKNLFSKLKSDFKEKRYDD